MASTRNWTPRKTEALQFSSAHVLKNGQGAGGGHYFFPFSLAENSKPSTCSGQGFG
jgi:hypothetical protein